MKCWLLSELQLMLSPLVSPLLVMSETVQRNVPCALKPLARAVGSTLVDLVAVSRLPVGASKNPCEMPSGLNEFGQVDVCAQVVCIFPSQFAASDVAARETITPSATRPSPQAMHFLMFTNYSLRRDTICVLFGSKRRPTSPLSLAQLRRRWVRTTSSGALMVSPSHRS